MTPKTEAASLGEQIISKSGEIEVSSCIAGMHGAAPFTIERERRELRELVARLVALATSEPPAPQAVGERPLAGRCASNNEADRLAELAQRLDAFLAQFDLDGQERILRYALDHVVPKLKGRAALAKQQAHDATAEPAAVREVVTELLVRVRKFLKEVDDGPRDGLHVYIAHAGDRLERFLPKVEAAIAAQGTQKAEQHRALSHEEAQEVDDALGLVTLPPIRVDRATHAALMESAKASGRILQAVVRDRLAPYQLPGAPPSAPQAALPAALSGLDGSATKSRTSLGLDALRELWKDSDTDAASSAGRSEG
jgi:hypothetical protein